MDQLKKLEGLLGYRFKKKELLNRAITHKSFANENKMPPEEHNERLEFLGDAVLELTVSELLVNKYPTFSEGKLSKLRAAIVNEKQLAHIARDFRLGEFLLLGKGEEQTGGREKDSLLADAFEAILGAIYQDRGFSKSIDFVHKHYENLLGDQSPENFFKDYKTDLQEKSQELYHSVPRYRLAKESGPDHDKVFDVELYIRQELMGRGVGRNKKEAEQQAAKEALERLQKL
ncbi:MAG: ribonuclease III [Deltaproteobacteria bacterium]|nr:MAG: ribonuclease III [Deltaproteobacteria bacterium]